MNNTTANKGKPISSSWFSLLIKKYNKLTANVGIIIKIQKVEKTSLTVSLAIAKPPAVVYFPYNYN
jgi:hypothetical protein